MLFPTEYFHHKLCKCIHCKHALHTYVTHVCFVCFGFSEMLAIFLIYKSLTKTKLTVFALMIHNIVRTIQKFMVMYKSIKAQG